MALFEPDRYFSRLSHVDVEGDLLGQGLDHVLLDIDNTILTRDTHEVPRDAALWLGRARSAGVAFCLLSNNWHHGVYELAERLELPLVARAVKPLPPAFLAAMGKVGGRRGDTVVIGDQLVTDVLGAHFVGLPAYMLQPLVETDLWHTLLLRHFERLVMGARLPEPAPSPAQAEGVAWAKGAVVAEPCRAGAEASEGIRREVGLRVEAPGSLREEMAR